MRVDSAHDAFSLKGLSGESGMLTEKTAVCVGLGAVNGRVVQELARLGIGRIYGIDGDRYGRDSWLTQPIRRLLDRRRSKAFVQGALGNAINPGCEIWTLRGLAQDVPLWIYRRADIIIVSGDNLELSVWIGNVAQALGKDLIELAVFGESLTAFVRRFDLSNPESPCPSCLMSNAEWQSVKTRHGCDAGVLRGVGQQPTRTQPMTCALAAQLGVAETLKALTGVVREQRLSNEELFYSMASHQVVRTALRSQSGLSVSSPPLESDRRCTNPRRNYARRFNAAIRALAGRGRPESRAGQYFADSRRVAVDQLDMLPRLWRPTARAAFRSAGDGSPLPLPLRRTPQCRADGRAIRSAPDRHRTMPRMPAVGFGPPRRRRCGNGIRRFVDLLLHRRRAADFLAQRRMRWGSRTQEP